tara:strand:- start:59867 stop:60637 length:771 start_codon:yes stop_codon:yes gene_type:complete
MPLFKIDQKLVYYAHVPKCGGSSIANYIRERFGALAFHDNAYFKQAPAQRWTASSPQHVDAATLERLIPLSFFSAVFSIVRHPVERAVSTYHFQLELEKSIPTGTSFTDWLHGLAGMHRDKPFAYDNHTRPMSDIVPDGGTIFYMEHGLDVLVPWFDALAGTQSGLRAIITENTRGEYVKVDQVRVTPRASDLDLIAEIYAADFKRFGYKVDAKEPEVPVPEISAAFMAQRDRALTAAVSPLGRIKRKAMRKFRQM